MSDEVDSRLRLDENLFKEDAGGGHEDKYNGGSVRVAIVEEQSALGGFLLHHFVARALKSGGKVVLVSLENTLGHFHGAGLKFGADILKASKSASGQVTFIDGLALVGESFLEPSLENGIIPKLKTEIDKALLSMENIGGKKKWSNLVLVVDKLSLLMSGGSSFAATVAFLQWLQVQTAQRGASLIVGTSGRSGRSRNKISGGLHQHQYNRHLLEGPNDRLAAFLDATSHLTVAVWPLNTGFSEDVTGNLAFGWRGHAKKKRGDSGRYQFKVGDKDVHMFAPGTSRAVL